VYKDTNFLALAQTFFYVIKHIFVHYRTIFAKIDHISLEMRLFHKLRAAKSASIPEKVDSNLEMETNRKTAQIVRLFQRVRFVVRNGLFGNAKETIS